MNAPSSQLNRIHFPSGDHIGFHSEHAPCSTIFVVDFNMRIVWLALSYTANGPLFSSASFASLLTLPWIPNTTLLPSGENFRSAYTSVSPLFRCLKYKLPFVNRVCVRDLRSTRLRFPPFGVSGETVTNSFRSFDRAKS